MLITSAMIKASESLNQGTVLIIEPTDNYRKTIQRYLTNLKVKSMKFCESLSAAKTELAISKVSLLVVEWQQPGPQNGLQFCREIRKDQRLKDIPFMLTSVESLRGDVVLASEVGIDGYMLKPFSFEDFSEQIVTLLKKAQERTRFTEFIERAESLIDREDYEGAEKALMECKEYDPQSARIQCALARIKRAQGEDREALALLKSAVEANPTYLEAYRLILEVYENKDRPHHILHFALQAHELSPENPRYMLFIAKAYLVIGDLEESERFFRKTIRISPSLAEGHKGLGDVHLLKEDYEKAMKHYRKALDLDSSDVSILNSIGLVYIKQENYEEGIKQYRLALKVDPRNAKVLFNLGHALEKLEQFEEAWDCFNRALVSEPDYEKALRGLYRVEKILKELGRSIRKKAS